MNKTIKNPFKWVGKPIKYQVNSWLNYYQYWSTKRKALKAWKNTGLQHHVIPSGKDSVLIVNNRWLKLYNQKAHKGQRINVMKLMEISYFSTPQGKRLLT